jgi:hypothetical protein
MNMHENWISVDERLPEKSPPGTPNRRVLVAVRIGPCKTPTDFWYASPDIGIYRDGEWDYAEGRRRIGQWGLSKVTHWMPLPETPHVGKPPEDAPVNVLGRLERIEKLISQLPTLVHLTYVLMKINAAKGREINLEDVKEFCKPIGIPKEGREASYDSENASRSDIIYEAAIEALARMKDEATNYEAIGLADVIARLLRGC